MAAGARSRARLKAARAFNEHASEYDSWFGDSLVYSIELAALQALPIAMVDPQLEIGVGPGHFARDLGVAIGLDPAWEPLRLAQQRGIKCCQGLGEELPFKDSAVGAVYLLFTLCFANDPEKMIAECARILKDRGCLIIGMIPAESNWGQHLAARKAGGHVFYEHASFYRVATVKHWLAGSQMEIVYGRSTLYQAPGRVEQNEASRETLDEQAGFAVIVARKGNG